MKKLILTALSAAAIVGTAGAQTILSEDFESGSIPSTWKVIKGYTGGSSIYNWHTLASNPESEAGSTISGYYCAEVEAPIYYSPDGEGWGPREEILLSPELNLTDTYTLQFTFRVSPMNAYDNSRYDLQVRVVEDGNLAGAETVFSIQNEKMMRDCALTTFPIGNWNPYTPKVDLSDFKGSKVQLAFVYKMYQESANVAWLDDITVTKSEPVTGPKAQLNMSRYDFGTLFLGEKMYTELITLTNTGKDGLKITGVDLPEGVGMTIDPATVNLDRYKTVNFQLTYTASLTSPTAGTATIHTNGGDVQVALSAKKQAIPEGYMLETFEQYFPPAGWTSTGWSWTDAAIEGDHSVYSSGGFGNEYLRSPRLDLLDGGEVTFTYFNQYENYDEDPYYDVELQVSYDGGDSWTTKWTSPLVWNQLTTTTVDLGYGDDNCYIRWYYPNVETDDEGAFPHSTFYLDRVLLPYVYGMDGVPLAAKVVSPKSGSIDINPLDLKLEWQPAMFAQGYKLYVGTNNTANDVINGLDLGNVLSYDLKGLAYSTDYRWKVVPYNEKGDCTTASTWRFTTMADQSVTQYPYIQNFQDENGNPLKDTLPLGWISTPGNDQYGREWYVNNIHSYDPNGKNYGVLCSYWLCANVENAISTQEFVLPADKPMTISFIWGDEHPADLLIDETGGIKKNNAEPNNGVSETFFDIAVDGVWTNCSTLSENYPEGSDKKYYFTEKYDLSAYAGKRVQFRWRHRSYSGKDDGASLTHIVLAENEDSKAAFNKEGWHAGKVNYEKAVNSGDMFSIINDGKKELVVKAVSFTTPNFETSLKAGDKVEIDGTLLFNITFKALQTAAAVDDNLVVTFESGYSMSLPVDGIALGEHTLYYSFEPNALDHVWDEHHTMIDVDRGNGYTFSSNWVHYGADGQKCAFSCESDSKEDGMYGMMKPVSGNYCLVASSPQSGSADNWIISKKLKACETSKFDFYARNWETLNSVLPAPKHHVEVLVSTAGNTKTSDFVTEMRDVEMEFLGEGEWHHFEVDLGKYSGKEIYVAVRHTTVGPSNLAFFDDFTYTDIDKEGNGIDSVAVADDEHVTVYNISGMLVAEGCGRAALRTLDAGMYIVKTADRVLRIAK